MSLTPLETRLQYRFKQPELLRQAVTHRSHSATHNERLEFLGDSVLNCVIATLLFQRFASLDEGDLSRVRANLVRQQTLFEVAQAANVAQFLLLGEGELRSGGMKRPSILADTLEAIFGAIYLDGGFEAAAAAVSHLYQPILTDIDPQTLGKDPKTLLQEQLQGQQLALPQYVVVATHGAAHNQEFEVECVIASLDIRVSGSGASRRAAEQAAATLALARLSTLGPSLGASRRGKPAKSKAKDAVPVSKKAPTTASTEGSASDPSAALAGAVPASGASAKRGNASTRTKPSASNAASNTTRPAGTVPAALRPRTLRLPRG